jgi:hypothetical protein
MSMPGYSSPIVAVDDQQVFQIADPTNTPPFNFPSIGSRSKNSSTWSCDWSQSHAAQRLPFAFIPRADAMRRADIEQH